MLDIANRIRSLHHMNKMIMRIKKVVLASLISSAVLSGCDLFGDKSQINSLKQDRERLQKANNVLEQSLYQQSNDVDQRIDDIQRQSNEQVRKIARSETIIESMEKIIKDPSKETHEKEKASKDLEEHKKIIELANPLWEMSQKELERWKDQKKKLDATDKQHQQVSSKQG